MSHDHRKPRSSSEPSSQGPQGQGPSNARLSRQVQAQLGQRLRAFYEALALGEQPVPDRFIEIIDRLDQGRNESRQEKRS
ncbi:MAG TPA: NepR family anti-sigma factor [Microvirga sp.]|jgi:hypothetical protein|nr:NepR family anti-sigma factor [Microvirga sp.]